MVLKLVFCCLGVSGWHVVLDAIVRGTELQKGCSEADVLLFGCLWVACGLDALVWGTELQNGCFETDVLLFGCLWVTCGFWCVCMGELITRASPREPKAGRQLSFMFTRALAL